MKCARVFLYLLALPLLVACTPTLFLHEEPLGEIATLNAQDWNGLWLMGRDDVRPAFASFNVVDGKNGIMQLRFLQMSEDCPLLLTEHYLFQWRQIGNWYFVSPEPLVDDDFQKYAPYGTRIAFFRDRATLSSYIIETARARTLILRKLIPGRIVQGRVILGRLSSEQHKLLFPNKGTQDGPDPEKALPPPVDWPQTMTLMKLPDELVPCK